MDRLGEIVVQLAAHVRAEHDWVARDGRVWAFRLVEVTIDGRHSTRYALLINEEDV